MAKHDKKTTTGRSKHVDIHYKFVTEYIEDGITEVIFVKSADNDSDIMTKNLGSDLHSKHECKMISIKIFCVQNGNFSSGVSFG